MRRPKLRLLKGKRQIMVFAQLIADTIGLVADD
jgi:hypothetical protein